ncbi:HD domain-containing protein, partial [Archaeoglobales archaeon]
MEKSIQDAVHGIIKLNEPMLKIVDTPQFQRLRRIRQLGFANLVYPGANHTRFEHSLGVMHITKLLQKRLELDDEVVIAALIHDVGHTPFSHSSESLLERYAGIRHEDLKKIVHGELKDVLNDLGYNLRKLSDIVSGKKQSIVCGDIDADRMDY